MAEQIPHQAAKRGGEDGRDRPHSQSGWADVSNTTTTPTTVKAASAIASNTSINRVPRCARDCKYLVKRLARRRGMVLMTTMLFQMGNRLWHTDSSFKRLPARA